MNKFRNLVLATLSVAAVSAIATGASAQASSSQTTNSSATIFQPIVLSKTSDLSFGTLVRPTSAGAATVVISQVDGTRTFTGGVALLNTGPNAAASRAAYSVVGEGGQTFAITVPASFSMTRTGGAETIVVSLTPTATTGTLSSTLGNAGAATFGVGGSIPVSNTTASGAYTGTFNVIVAYN